MQLMIESSHEAAERTALGHRLKKALRHGGIESERDMKRSLSQWFSVTEEAVRKWLVGETIPKSSRMYEIAKRTRVRPEWLTHGSGPMVSQELDPMDAWNQRRDSDDPEYQGRVPPPDWDPREPGDGSSAGAVREDPPGDEFVTIPFHLAEASAGYGSFNDEHARVPGGLMFRRRSLARRNLHADKLRNVFVRGDSMEPTFVDGDLVIIDTTRTDVIDGEIYGIAGADGEVRLKRLFRALDGRIRVTSDNPDKTMYPEEVVSSDAELRVIGRFVWLGRFNPRIK